jgi:type III secretion system low calcium response chaperone LcrH/SycD
MKESEINDLLGFNLMETLPEDMRNIEFLNKIMKETCGKDPKKFLLQETGLTEDQLESLYAIAYNYYNQGLYQKALDVFKLLISFDRYSYRFSFSAGSCLQMLEDYVTAIQIFFGCALLDSKAPEPYFYALECSLKLHNKDNAIFCAEKFLERAGDKKEHAQSKIQVEIILKGLTKKKKKKKTKSKAKKKA